jgi:glycosyltransferase involved in cell wall biosynthesis
MAKPAKKIYFVHQGLMSFVKKDLETLEENYEVKTVNNFNRPLYKIPQNFLGVMWCDVVFCWFGSLRFFAPIILGKLLGKKIIIVTGGYDVVRLPEIHYGNMRGGFRSWLEKKLFKMADRVICISNSNMKETMQNAGVPFEKITMIYHGFEIPNVIGREKDQIVITVGKVTEENLLRKGLRFFIDVAKFFPDIPFICVGSMDNCIKEKLKDEIPSNVTLTGWVSAEELEDYFNRAKVYVQASMHEGFGCSVAEAMLHECIPVVSYCYALPEVVGDAGYLVKTGNLEDLREKIAMALTDSRDTRRRARTRIENQFSLEQRRNSLLNLMDSLW